jgi:hypothetical protein
MPHFRFRLTVSITGSGTHPGGNLNTNHPVSFLTAPSATEPAGVVGLDENLVSRLVATVAEIAGRGNPAYLMSGYGFASDLAIC